MGWFWQANSTSTTTPPPSTSTTSPAASQQPAPPSTQQDVPSSSPPPPKHQDLTPDEKELAAFLSALNEGSVPPVRPIAASHLPPSHPSYAPNRPSPQSAALNEATLPTTMSCRDAFDYAWHCHTPAAQFQSVYRYGGVRTCSDLWDDFWFCMRTKQYSPEMRAEAVKEHFRRRLNERYYAPGRKSSEDVWESREGIVPEGSAFRHGFDEPKEDDKEWNLREIERRRRIREEHFGQREGGN